MKLPKMKIPNLIYEIIADQILFSIHNSAFFWSEKVFSGTARAETDEYTFLLTYTIEVSTDKVIGYTNPYECNIVDIKPDCCNLLVYNKFGMVNKDNDFDFNKLKSYLL